AQSCESGRSGCASTSRISTDSCCCSPPRRIARSSAHLRSGCGRRQRLLCLPRRSSLDREKVHRPHVVPVDAASEAPREETMAWILLVLAGLFEVGWAIGLKYTHGFTRLWPTLWTIGTMIVSLWLLGLAMRSLPVGTAYSVWVGVGAVGTVVLGIVLFGDSAHAARLVSIGLIIAGVIGLKLTTPAT